MKSKGRSRSVAVPVLCKFWFEDEVWNGTAEHMAVAVFGNTFEQALENMRAAIQSHVESMIETGKAPELMRLLQEKARDYGFLSLDEISTSSPLVKMLVTVNDRELVAVA